MKQILVLATTNPGKTREFRDLLRDFPVEIRNLSDFGPIPPVVEDGSTFEENAYKKASVTARILGFPALADDSGLCVAALDGAPGIHSARFAGDRATDADNVARLLSCLENQENRQASFHCVISLAVPTGQALTYEGSCDGRILTGPQGENGFGYDPVFFYPELNRTFAQMTLAEKARVSHRGKALAEMVQEMDKILQWLDMHEIRTQRSGCGGQK